jgi:hypothetical protein
MSRRDEIESLLAESQRRLHQLKLQQARFGYNTPPHVLMKIEDLEKEIPRLGQTATATQAPAPISSTADSLTSSQRRHLE